ncbi:MAG: hypothetical protein IJD70_01400 [Clostridia bacterium]|nr:hypothetical protein [Clostridia bacterium]
MLNFFQRRSIRSFTERMTRAFPLCLRNDVEQICKKIIIVNNRFHYDDSTKWLLSSGEIIAIPYRIVLKEPNNSFESSLTQTQKNIYHCIMSRNSDGYIREKHIKALLEKEPPEWAIPYIIKICDEYVVEILQTVYDAINQRDCRKYREICSLNFDYIKRAHTRMISYWNEYYRWDCYRYKDYIGKKLYRDCFGYTKTGQKEIKLD